MVGVVFLRGAECRNQQQSHVVRLAQVREWFGPVAKLDVGVDLVQGVISSFSTFNMLVEFRERCF